MKIKLDIERARCLLTFFYRDIFEKSSPTGNPDITTDDGRIGVWVMDATNQNVQKNLRKLTYDVEKDYSVWNQTNTRYQIEEGVYSFTYTGTLMPEFWLWHPLVNYPQAYQNALRELGTCRNEDLSENHLFIFSQAEDDPEVLRGFYNQLRTDKSPLINRIYLCHQYYLRTIELSPFSISEQELDGYVWRMITKIARRNIGLL